jgi:hypothetical protein
MRTNLLPRLLLAAVLACCAALPLLAGCSDDSGTIQQDAASKNDLSATQDLSGTDAAIASDAAGDLAT